MTSATNHSRATWTGGVLSAAIVIRGASLGRGGPAKESDHPRTDDCEIVANYIGIAPQVEGPIIHLNVHDNQLVQEGELLFEIDDRPYRVRPGEGDLRAEPPWRARSPTRSVSHLGISKCRIRFASKYPGYEGRFY